MKSKGKKKEELDALKKDLTEASQTAVEGVISRVKENSITLSLRTDEQIPFGFETRCWL